MALSLFTLLIVAIQVKAQDAAECPVGYVCTLSGTDSNITTDGQMTTTIKQQAQQTAEQDWCCRNMPGNSKTGHKICDGSGRSGQHNSWPI